MTEFHKEKYMFGTVKVGERGQIVIPKEARDAFNIKAGDELLVLGVKKNEIAVVKAVLMKKLALRILGETVEDENKSN